MLFHSFSYHFFHLEGSIYLHVSCLLLPICSGIEATIRQAFELGNPRSKLLQRLEERGENRVLAPKV